MPKKRFSAEQIVRLLRQIEVSMAQGKAAPVACRDAGISLQSACGGELSKEYQVMSRGTEWYILRDGLIVEVRAYFAADQSADTELADFPYADRKYLTRK